MLYLCSINRSSQPTDFHLLGAHDPATSAGEFSRPVHLDPVEQGLVHHAQRARCCHDGLTSIEAASCLKSSAHLTFVSDGANPLLNAGEEAVLQDWREKG